MTDQDTSSPSETVNPEQAYIDQLRAEATTLPESERQTHEALIAELAGELALTEAIQRQAAEDIKWARQMASSSRQATAEEKSETLFPLDFAQIGWLKESEVEPLPVEYVTSSEQGYYFASIIDRNNAASKALDRLQRQGIADKLISTIKSENLPKLWKDIVSGGRVRVVSAGGNRGTRKIITKGLNTTYPAYKIDVQGTNNRAIVLIGGKIDGEPVMVLSALYDHKDQGNVMNQMSLGSSRNSTKGMG